MSLVSFMRRTKTVDVVTIDQSDIIVRNVTEEVRLIKNTRFEEWLIKMKKPNPDQRQIFISIMITYYYMRMILGMQYQAISIEDFEIIEERLRVLGCDIWKRNGDSYSNLNGFVFRNYAYWYNYHPWHFKFDSFDPFSLRSERLIMSGKYEYTLPPNIQQLTREIYQKRFGRPIPRPE